MTRYSRAVAAIALSMTVAGCAVVPEDMRRETLNEGDVPVVMTSKPTPNNTPLTAKLICYGERLERAGKGHITEVNFNIQSGGGELSVNNAGGKGRIYTMNVGIDLRIVGSQTLKVYDTVSVQKQISGYEVGLDVFRFFNSDLWDVNAGAKNQEPLQLAVRMAIESALLDIG